MKKEDIGKVITARGLINPSELGSFIQHEHLHVDLYDWEKEKLLVEEKPMSAARFDYLRREQFPFLKKCVQNGCRCIVDASPAPWRAWPDFYLKATAETGMNVVLCTGFYREIETGTYFVKKPEDAIWPFVRSASVEELTEFCVREIVEGLHGTEVRAGAIKLGTSQPETTPTETKALRAGARAQKRTGVHITTHCTKHGAESSQLTIFDDEGVDLNRVVIGHTAKHLMDPERRRICMEWMRRGANFLPTNLGIGEDGGEPWRSLIEGIHEIFDAGLGDHVAGFGLDWAFVSESGPFGPCGFVPPPPFLHMFTHTLPAFRELGLTPEEEKTIMIDNPRRIVPVGIT